MKEKVKNYIFSVGQLFSDIVALDISITNKENSDVEINCREKELLELLPDFLGLLDKYKANLKLHKDLKKKYKANEIIEDLKKSNKI